MLSGLGLVPTPDNAVTGAVVGAVANTALQRQKKEEIQLHHDGTATSQRTVAETEYTKVVLAVIQDFGKDLLPECNPLRDFGKQHDSDDNRFLQALEWIRIRYKRTHLDRTSSDIQYDAYTILIDSHMARFYNQDVVGTLDICKARNFILQLLRDIYLLIEKKFGNKDPEGKITQLETLRNIILGITRTQNIWQAEGGMFKRLFSGDEENSAFQLLILALDSNIQDTLKPLYSSFSRSLLPNALNNLAAFQEKTLVPCLAELVLHSITDQTVDKAMLLDDGVKLQLETPGMTHEGFCKTDVGRFNRHGKVLARHANLFALSQNLLAPAAQKKLAELREAIAQQALQDQKLQQAMKAAAASEAEEKIATPPPAFDVKKLSQPLINQERPSPSARINRLKSEYLGILDQLYNDAAVDKFLPPNICAILQDKSLDDAAKKKTAEAYRKTLKDLLKFYHKQVQLLAINKQGSMLAAHINTLLTIIMPQKVAELSNYNLIFYTQLIGILDEFMEHNKKLREMNSSLQGNRGWLHNAIHAWTLAGQLTSNIRNGNGRNGAFHLIDQINHSLTKKNIRSNTEELLKTLAQFSTELSLATEVNPGESSLEHAMKDLLLHVHKITAAIPDNVSDARILQSKLTDHSQEIGILTQTQLDQAIANPLLIQLVMFENQIRYNTHTGIYYLFFINGPRYQLEGKKAADWIRAYKRHAVKSLRACYSVAVKSSQDSGEAKQTASNRSAPRSALPSRSLNESPETVLVVEDGQERERIQQLTYQNEVLTEQIKAKTLERKLADRHQDFSFQVFKPTMWWLSWVTGIAVVIHLGLMLAAGIYRLWKSEEIARDLKTFAALEKEITDATQTMEGNKNEISQLGDTLGENQGQETSQQQQLAKEADGRNNNPSANPPAVINTVQEREQQSAPHRAVQVSAAALSSQSFFASPIVTPISLSSTCQSMETKEEGSTIFSSAAYNPTELAAMELGNAQQLAQNIIDLLDSDLKDAIAKHVGGPTQQMLVAFDAARTQLPNGRDINNVKVRRIIYEQIMEILYKPTQPSVAPTKAFKK